MSQRRQKEAKGGKRWQKEANGGKRRQKEAKGGKRRQKKAKGDKKRQLKSLDTWGYTRSLNDPRNQGQYRESIIEAQHSGV